MGRPATGFDRTQPRPYTFTSGAMGAASVPRQHSQSQFPARNLAGYADQAPRNQSGPPVSATALRPKLGAQPVSVQISLKPGTDVYTAALSEHGLTYQHFNALQDWIQKEWRYKNRTNTGRVVAGLLALPTLGVSLKYADGGAVQGMVRLLGGLNKEYGDYGINFYWHTGSWQNAPGVYMRCDGLRNYM